MKSTVTQLSTRLESRVSPNSEKASSVRESP